MHRIPLMLILAFLSHFSSIVGQFSVSGVVLDEQNNPLPGVAIYSISEDLISTSNEDGRFELNFLSNNPQQIKFADSNFEEQIRIVDENTTDLVVVLRSIAASLEETDFQVITLSDDELEVGGSSQNISSILQASNDVFVNNTAFQFNVARFNARGLGVHDSRMFLNGMPVNDLDDGRINWSYWGGLNDVLRNRRSNYGLGNIEYSFGDLAGTQSIDLRARYQRKQIRPSFAVSNRSYRNRAMFTYSTGLKDNKYALTVSGSRRWGNEGYIDATFYDAWSYFLSFDYKISETHALNFVALGAPTERGRSGASVQELYDLAGSNYYNSYWGYQNGQKRNSRVYNTFQPIFMLRHDYEKTDLRVSTTVAYQTGRFGSSRLDWYNTSDPRPDYYRNLPSFYEDSPEIAQKITERYQNEAERQIDWDYLYFINKNTTEDFFDDAGNLVASGHRARYLLGEQRFDADKFTFNTNLNYKFTNQLLIDGGAIFIQEDNHNFQSALDLLGADYYIDIDRFAERDFKPDSDELQNDLNNPNKIVSEGDIYGFDYNTLTRNARLWTQVAYKSPKLDAYIGGEIGQASFWRVGNMRNGKFPDNSFGKSEVSVFSTFGVKGGLSYKLNGRNYINLSSMYLTKPPLTRFAFVSPRTRHDVAPSLEVSKNLSSELTYHHRSPGAKIKLSAYYSTQLDITEVSSFYHDELRGFVNFIVSDIDYRQMGIEAAADIKLSTTLSLVGAAAIGDYLYTSRPSATISQDNNAELLEVDQTIYTNNFFIHSTPQNAYTLGLKYNSPRYWFLNLNFNYFDKMYLSFNPTRRTQNAVAELIKEENIELWQDILYQEKLPANYTADLFGGKSWKIGQRFIYLTVGINNILNNTNFITGGYEQNRFDFENLDVDRFPPRYFYAYGTNYFIGLSFRL
ncbi:carboxypeptidase-like regulatory domain-containing protein [Portibacter marinus]|uniref:carboxypeptidase-like regulatory domain-containing protein n=1 Tax=Portibacter marinus TaxID=2898660 RepID=UPI001F24F5E7|nr:carboxypeptidase-like regulatory domain-containing protein [Portibacter marinus]